MTRQGFGRSIKSGQGRVGEKREWRGMATCFSLTDDSAAAVETAAAVGESDES
jgi:hypothetical protein